MKPISFTCTAIISSSPQEISANIADMSKWEEFTGYGFLPGIAKASYEKKSAQMTGSRIQVQNTDGSTHIEEILSWNPDKTIRMKLHEFSPPLNKLATHFHENWTFEQTEKGTLVSRSFELFPSSPFTRPFLWLISLFFRKAIDHHLHIMKEESLGK